MLLPGILIAFLRMTVTGEIDAPGAMNMVARLALASVLLAWGYAGVSVGPSAATKRARWALLLALAFFTVPDAILQAAAPGTRFVLGPGSAANAVLESLFERGSAYGIWGAFVLLAYGGAGWLVTAARVRKEMIP
jgi:hypothetical protein